jgi:hypothetical protein
MLRTLKLGTVLLILLAIVAVAFCPIPSGPYSATHGPVTAGRTLYQNLNQTFTTVFAAVTASFWLAVVVTLAPLVPFRSQTSAALGLKCSPVLRI